MNQTTILVVDDDELSRDLLQLLLARAGYRVSVAASGEEAVSLLEAGLEPDAVLSDLQMPGLSRNALARRLRSVAPGIKKLLAMSGSEPAEGSCEAFDAFLLKPFTMETLAKILAEEKPTTVPRKPSNSTNGFTSTVLDADVYTKLSASMKPERLQQLYTLCLDDVTQRCQVMRAAALAGDDATYRREAHAIKGGCGMVGAHELQLLAASEENKGIPANHVATFDEIANAVERLRRMLVAHRHVL